MRTTWVLMAFWFLVGKAVVGFGMQPDLVVSMRVLGAYSTDADGNFLIPISVTTLNQGRDLAGRFKVSTDYRVSTGATGLAPMRFIGSPTASFRGDNFYVWSLHAFSVSMSRVFSAVVTLPRALAGRLVSLRARVDSCVGEEFMPDYCRIAESREDNNESRAVTLRLD